MLHYNQKSIDPFSTRRRHKDLDVYHLLQSFFDLPKRTIRINSSINILFKQTLKDVENIEKKLLDLISNMMKMKISADKH